jgi:hypothetical protein
MAKKTIKADYEPHDTAMGLRRELLSYKKNADLIYYEVDASDANPQRPLPKTQESEAAVTSTPSSESAPAPLLVPASATVTPPVADVSLPDKPIIATDVLVVLAAVSLKRPASEIETDQSIKKLCGGISLTLFTPYHFPLTKKRSVDRPE